MTKTRPCVIVSPNELNLHLRTVIIAPITTSTISNYLWRVLWTIAYKKGEIAVDQIKVVDKTRIGSKMSKLSNNEISQLK